MEHLTKISSVALKIGIHHTIKSGYFEKKICITLSNEKRSPWKKVKTYFGPTLDSGINVAHGIFGKNIKHSP